MQCESIRVNHRTPALKGCHASAQPSERWTPVSKYLRPEPDTGSRRCHQHSRFISETFFLHVLQFPVVEDNPRSNPPAHRLSAVPRVPINDAFLFLVQEFTESIRHALSLATSHRHSSLC
jgi:hypothetical protein